MQNERPQGESQRDGPGPIARIRVAMDRRLVSLLGITEPRDGVAGLPAQTTGIRNLGVAFIHNPRARSMPDVRHDRSQSKPVMAYLLPNIKNVYVEAHSTSAPAGIVLQRHRGSDQLFD
jgi:hypothetical protein